MFLTGEPISVERLSRITGDDKNEVEEALGRLRENLSERGIVLVKKDEDFLLGTSPYASEIIKSLIKDEISSDLTKAALETLSAVVYKGPLSKMEIDYIRGVNSSYTLRSLMVRGLVEREQNPRDARSFIYKPSFEFLKFMGVKDISEVPEYNALREKIGELIKSSSPNTDL